MNRARVHRCGLLLVAGACVLATGASGCGKGSATADVSGTIKIAGKPPKLERFQIAFMGGRENQIVTFPVALDGTYTATGVPVGEVKVGFVYIPPEAAKAGKTRLPVPKGKEPPTGPTKEVINPIPAGLREPSTSKVTFTVESGTKNTFNYDISSAQ